MTYCCRASDSIQGPKIGALWCTKETQAFGREQVSILTIERLCLCFNS